jgi:hypothetical protein
MLFKGFWEPVSLEQVAEGGQAPTTLKKTCQQKSLSTQANYIFMTVKKENVFLVVYVAR